MKRWLAILLAVTAGCVACGTFADVGPRRFGPLTCEDCLLAEPRPDKLTLRTLQEFAASMNFGKVATFKDRIAPRDTVVVCNRNSCVDYVRTDGDAWEGTNPRPQQQHSYIETIKRMRPEFVHDYLREQMRQPGQPPPQWYPAPGPRPGGRVTVGPIKRH